MGNQLRSNSSKLLAYLAELDPLQEEIKAKVNETQLRLRRLAEQDLSEARKDAFHEHVDHQLLGFLQAGSQIKVKNFSIAQAELMKRDRERTAGLSVRVLDSQPAVKRLVRNLRARVLSKEFLELGAVRGPEDLKRELERVFAQFPKPESEDFLIVDTIYKNLNTNNQNEILVQDLLEKVSGDLERLVARAIDATPTALETSSHDPPKKEEPSPRRPS